MSPPFCEKCFEKSRPIVVLNITYIFIMYMDNPKHKELRKHVQIPINLTNSIIEDLAKSKKRRVY
ncbi:hypothetical protein CN917_21260 [Bacillus thuringiensis]|nr:hypothetical protein CN917_21260 [Bacillus thuringiensis]